MLYLEEFYLPDLDTEADFVLSYPSKLEMTCYTGLGYPFGLFPQKGLTTVTFAPITLLYGGNGSGKSTLLNVMAEKMALLRTAPYNRTPLFEEYLSFCRVGMSDRHPVPQESRIITSDDVFDYMLDVRSANGKIDREREELFARYHQLRDRPFRLSSLEDYEALRENNDAKHKTKSQYTARRLPVAFAEHSNGENAFAYFTEKITENALYLLDEPENSLSAARQQELAAFLIDSARFYGCQFVISTHSPFLLSIAGAKIYNLDARPVKPCHWTEPENVRIYYEFFMQHQKDFAASSKSK